MLLEQKQNYLTCNVWGCLHSLSVQNLHFLRETWTMATDFNNDNITERTRVPRRPCFSPIL